MHEETASVANSHSSIGDGVYYDNAANFPSYLDSPVTSFSDQYHSTGGPLAWNHTVSQSPSHCPPSGSKCPWLSIQSESATEARAGTALHTDSHLSFNPGQGTNQAHSQPPTLDRRAAPTSVPQTNTPSSILTQELPPHIDGGMWTGLADPPTRLGPSLCDLSGRFNSPTLGSIDHYQFASQPVSPTVSNAPLPMTRNWSAQSHPTVPSSGISGRRRRHPNHHTHSTGTKPIPIPHHRPRARRTSFPRTFHIATFASDERLARHERGKRKGPMQPDKRDAARRTRQSKSICIRCKLTRQSCQPTDDAPDAPCDNCRKLSVNSKWPGPCIRAYFDDIILSGGLDFMGKLLHRPDLLTEQIQSAQRIVYHVTRDGARTMRWRLPEVFDFDELLRVLDEARGRFNVRVRHGIQSVYVLNLDECFAYLSRIHAELQSSGPEHNLRKFLDQDMLNREPKGHDWTSLVLDCSLQTDKLRLLHVLGQMTSHATFHYVPKTQRDPSGTAPERVMDATSSAEAPYVKLAAYLIRIVNRKAEVDGFAQLRSQLHSSYSRQTPVHNLVALHTGLGRILTGLRWRVNCCALLAGSNADESDDSAEDKAEALADPGRAMELCRVLYFYFYSVWRRILSIGLVEDRDELVDGVWVQYPEAAETVWDAFPRASGESFLGLEAWMEQGRQLVLDSGAAQRLLGGLL
ncbi:hypothetical protein ACRALDRAFT_1060751 [Sodiomyces alcalophilus JCM 7366]|uniref:uncharacterized protein n=1 Tax=Sodiomyces alcalophilus JCM 7366 TaxID=591952 RepID=UPI0039B3689D